MGARAIALIDWRVALRLGRVSNLPTVWSNTLAGIVLSGAVLGGKRVILLLAAFSLFYLAGMFLNDAFDRNFDTVARSERPIPAGEVSAATVFAAGFAMLLAALLLVALFGLPALIAGFALTAAILFYDLHHKGNRLSPLVMGLCRVLVYLTASLAVARMLPLPVVLGAACLFAYLIGLTYVAKRESLVPTDQSTDLLVPSPRPPPARGGGVEHENPLPLREGVGGGVSRRQKSSLRNVPQLGSLWPLLLLFVPVAYGLARLPGAPLAVVPWLAFLAWTLRAASFLRPGRYHVRRCVTGLIVGIALLDSMLMAGAGSASGALAGFAAFLLAGFLQRYIAGT